MKKYIKPTLETYNVKNQAILADSTLNVPVGSGTIEGDVDAKGAFPGFEDDL